MQEPSVLDYVKARLMPWRGPAPEIPPLPGEMGNLQGESVPAETAAGAAVYPGVEPYLSSETGTDAPGQPPARLAAFATATAGGAAVMAAPMAQARSIVIDWPWRSGLALLLALFAQAYLQQKPQNWQVGAGLFLLALGWMAWGVQQGEWFTTPPKASELSADQPVLNLRSLLVGIVFAALGFYTSSGNLFTPINLILILGAVYFVMDAFWRPSVDVKGSYRRLRAWLAAGRWPVEITPAALLGVGALLLALFFRYYRLGSVPAEMNSDHAEKLLDIYRLLQGQTLIFFANNGGREALEFYSAAALHLLFGVPLSYILLKLVTATAGFLSLPFIYLFAKEVANRRVGFLAMIFASVAYWPNVVARVGLRLPFVFLFSAATLYFLVKALRTQQVRDYVFCGLALGLGFYGYTPDRILPLAVVAAVGLYLIHRQSRGQRTRTILYTIAVALLALVIFLPMLRFMLEDPNGFLYRSLSRMGSVEQPLPGPAWKIFLNNMWRALTMFSWSDGEVWVISIPYRPALDLITGALYWLGLGFVLQRYLRSRHWLDLFLLVSLPILMLPSVMALAFPNENPNLYRTGCTLVIAFTFIALALDGLMNALESRLPAPNGRRTALVLAGGLLFLSASLSYNLVFNDYALQYKQSAWNSSEIGTVIHDFATSIGSPDNAWVVAYPYWVDTRLVGMVAGYVTKDYAIAPEKLGETAAVQGPKLFILKPEDQGSVTALRQLYPAGWLKTYQSQVPSKEFLIYMVPASR